MKKGDIARFWSKVDVRGKDECWPWTGAISNGRYGHLWGGDKLVYAHRFSFELHSGPIPDGMDVCHSCDVPSCVNPAHLWLGTRKDNVADMIEKGRGNWSNRACGEKQGNSKLTKEQVLDIRAKYATRKHTQQELADMFGVVQSAIGRVVRRERWKHI